MGERWVSGGDLCAHCGDRCEAGTAVEQQLGSARLRYCCHGCAFIAEELFRVRSGAANSSAAPPENIHAAERCTFPVYGMVCAACALLIEARLRALPGVAQAHVDFGAQRALVRFDAARVDAARLRARVQSLGYATERSVAQTQRAARVALARVLLAWLVMMQVMMLAFPAYITATGDIASDVEQLLRVAQLVLTVPVMLFCVVPLLRAAVHQLRARAVGMDVPIALGLLAAFGASVAATVQAQGAVYFDSITMFVALVLASRWVQARALERSQARVQAAEQAAVQPARRLRASDDAASTAHDVVSATQLAPGDRLWVLAGDAFAADGVIASGTSAVSQAWLMGEARPTSVGPGAAVLAGSINLEAPVVLEVTRTGEQTALAALRRLVDQAGEARPPVMEMAHRVARVFLWVVLCVCAGTWAVWSLIDPTQALPNVLAVLIATCPCALSLAAPTVWSAAQARLARGGVLLTRAAALESLAHIDTFAFDKTGTLTTHTPRLLKVALLRDDHRSSDGVLAIAAALARASTHPYSSALSSAADDARLEVLPAQDLHVRAGQGVEGTVHERRYRLGRMDYALELCGGAHAAWGDEPAAGGVAVLADARGPIALFNFGETLRTGAADAVHELRGLGVRPVLISGDRAASVQQMAAQVGLQADEALAQMRPQDKREYIERLQRAGQRVAMMGDGMNDAPVLAQADVSFAIGSELGGAALAQTRADFIVLNADLTQVAATVLTARQALQRVRQNFFWAALYNIGVLPLAALGWLSPAMAAVGMAASSLLVVGNALRRPRR